MATDEQELARHLLARRDRDQSVLALLWQSRVRYLAVLIILSGSIGLTFQTRSPEWRTLGIFAAGMAAGVLARDIRWLRTLNHNRAFHRRIIDWAKVEALANGIAPEKLRQNPAE
ncbi:hypothetical protein [Planctellipticum variicoloris]|uniref:hypothetical protein n=1 Tax=Planctellipticum variicoloris TaxID=3064265 RepID=UPI003013ADFA|nr:hypothetical protein SH412_004188 [Planctomycetaceae bacterium SH412]